MPRKMAFNTKSNWTKQKNVDLLRELVQQPGILKEDLAIIKVQISFGFYVFSYVFFKIFILIR